eukprot:GFUD01022143.1.p1 GENE.GFUD01022143.1~~GFUD01022143.1.p1  ORF type:complete len:345 (+),score=101.16 GFUD01022143.1:70-1104(+)
MSEVKSTPLYDVTIDHSTADTLNQGCIEVLSRVRPSWPSSEVQLKLFTDGLTNKLVGAWHGDKQDMVLVRIYGEDTDKFIDRDSEKENMRKMEEGGCGGKLYAAFKNGLSYEFVPGKTLQPEMLFDPQIYRQVAKSVAKMHKIEIVTKSVGMWDFLDKLVNLYPEQFGDKKKQKLFEEHLLTKTQLKQEVSYLRERLTNLKSPVVFSHNDAMPANMVLKEDNTIALIDLEYGGPNHAAFDLANLFNEYIGCDELLDYKRNYPNEYLMKDWISYYLTEFHGSVPTKEDISELYKEVVKFSICGHLIWSTWAVIQAVNSQIEFDYMDYARQRVEQYSFVKNKMLSY